MAGKLLDLNEAASMLGVTPEQLVEMRSRGEIFGQRQGTNWMFKSEEVERVLRDRNDGDNEILSADDNEFANFVTGLSSKIATQKPEDEPESILISDDDLSSPDHGGSGSVTGSKIGGSGIGTSGSIKTGSVIKDGSHKDGDIRLASDSDLGLAASGSQKPSDILAGGSNKDDGQGATDLMGGSDSVHLGDDGELSLDALDDLSLGSVSSTGDDELKLAGDDDSVSVSDGGSKPGSGKGSGKGSDLSLGDELSLSQSPSGSAVDKDNVTDFDLGLDDEMSVLGDEVPKGRGSGHGSDVTHGGGDSGINLAPSDGGLSLEDEPMDLGGSAVDSLELPEEDGVIELEDAADPDQATQLKADDQFMLSPSDALGTEEDSDSGSQVIALEDSESFDQDAATMLNAQEQMGEGLVAEDAFGAPLGGAASAFGQAPAYSAQPAGAPGYAPAPLEIPYSIWQVLSLFLLTGVLTVAGMLMVDVVSNIWAFEGNGQAATFVMDAVISTVGLDK